MEQQIKKIKEALKENEIIGLVIPDVGYDETLVDIARDLSRDYNKILYISINKTYETLSQKLSQNKTDLSKFYFIDCITKTAENPVPEESSSSKCIYLSSPKAVDEMNRAIFKILDKEKIDLALIDSPSALLTYYEHMDVLKLMHFLMVKLIISKSKGIFPFPKEGAGPVRRSVEMFTDEIVNLD